MIRVELGANKPNKANHSKQQQPTTPSFGDNLVESILGDMYLVPGELCPAAV
jgi:hypothetical protein